METTEFTVLEEIELDNPIFIEALPGLDMSANWLQTT